MKTEIISQEKNPFLNREELTVKITEEDMPTKDGLIEALGKDKETTVIRKIESGFGKGDFTADITVYSDIESKDKYMTIPKKIRAKMEEEKKAAEEAAKKAEAEAAAAKEAEAAAAKEEAEAPKEETPAEAEKPAEKPEEAKEETKEEENSEEKTE